MTLSLRGLGSQLVERQQRMIRTVVVVAITLFLAYYLGRRPSTMYVVLPVALIGVWVLMHYTYVGVALILVTAILVPFAIGTGTQTSLNLPFILVPILLIVWSLNMLRQRSFKLTPSRTNLPLLGFVVTATLAFIYGNLPIMGFAQQASVRSQFGGWGIFAFSAGAFLLVGNHIKDLRWLRFMVWFFVAAGVVFFIGLAVPGASRIQRVIATGAEGSLFWLWFVALAAGQALFNHQLKPPIRLLLLIGVLMAMFGALTPTQRGWASGWLPMTVTLAVLIWLRWPRLGIVVGVLLIVVAAINFEAVRGFALTGDNEYSLMTRTAAAQIVGQIIRANPILGVGPANYYWYTPLFSLLGYFVRFNSHNQYVDIVAQIGFLGLFFFTWFVLATSRLGWSLRRKVEDGFSKGYVNAGLAGLAGTLAAGMLGDWVLPFVYNIGIRGFRASVLAWLFLGGLVAIEQMVRHQRSEQPPA